MKFPVMGALAALLLGVFVQPAAAQGPPPPTAIPGKLQYDANRTGRVYDQIRASTILGAPKRESGNPLQVKAAAKLAADTHVPCDVIDAVELKNGRGKAADGSTVEVLSYEIACKDALGWLIVKTGAAPAQANDCLALMTSATAAGKDWPKTMLCGLAANGSPVSGLRPIVAKVAPSCVLADGTYLGAGGQPPILRYEFACADGKGYVVDTPAPGSTATLQALTCDEVKATGGTCALTDKKRG